MTYTIDTENNIQAQAVAPAPLDNVVAFTTEKGLANALGECGIGRLVAIWNSFAGTPGFDDLKPVKKFQSRSRAIRRIWDAVQNLAPVPAPQAAPKPARKAKASKAATTNRNSSTGTAVAGVPRAFSKQNIVRDMLERPGGATLEEITKVTSWQKHTVRGFISTLPKKTGVKIISSRRESDKARVYEAMK